MNGEHPYRACPGCGGTEYDNLPDVALELWTATQVLGLTARQKAGTVVMNLVVCASCGKTDVYTRNVAEVRARVPGASRFRATPP